MTEFGHPTLSKLKLPMGSVVVDVALVVALVWNSATITEQLNNLEHRIAATEAFDQSHGPGAEREIAALKTELRMIGQNNLQDRQEMMRRLDRIEDLIQLHMQHVSGYKSGNGKGDHN